MNDLTASVKESHITPMPPPVHPDAMGEVLQGKPLSFVEKAVNWLSNGCVALGGAVAVASYTTLGRRFLLAKRALTDKAFAETFKDGALKGLHDSHAADYAKATFSPENLRDIWPNTKKHWSILWDSAKEMKEKGIGWKECWQGETSLSKIGTVAAPLLLAAMGIAALIAKRAHVRDAAAHPVIAATGETTTRVASQNHDLETAQERVAQERTARQQPPVSFRQKEDAKREQPAQQALAV